LVADDGLKCVVAHRQYFDKPTRYHEPAEEEHAMAPMLNVMQLSPQAFAHLGLEDVAYVKRVTTNEQQGFAVHAADGTRLAVLHDRATAFAAIRRHEMKPVDLH
jgi:hypothetical protein